MKLNFLGLFVLVIVVGAVVGGAYGAGIAIGKANAPAPASTQGALGAADALAANANTRGGTGGMGAMGGAGLTGTVEKLEANTLTLSTQSGGSAQVTLSDSTSIRKTADAGKEELKQGVRVMVVGQQGTGGVVAASSVQIIPADGAAPGQQLRSKPQGASAP